MSELIDPDAIERWLDGLSFRTDAEIHSVVEQLLEEIHRLNGDRSITPADVAVLDVQDKVAVIRPSAGYNSSVDFGDAPQQLLDAGAQLVLLLPPGYDIAMLDEDEMRENGWVRHDA